MGVNGIVFCVSLVLVQLVTPLPSLAVGSRSRFGHHVWEPLIRSPVDDPEEKEENQGTKWAILVAGSNGWENYRHQVNTKETLIEVFNCLIDWGLQVLSVFRWPFWFLYEIGCIRRYY